jgi:diaminohydroxyphosphoribosylaminopyrimidine deaminase / 5-amino-6-(5-phosphoribosylamino)uracil reductase
MSIDTRDTERMLRALALAEQAIGRSDPNPRVGCVLADAAGQVIGEGSTQRAGEAHAEAMALRHAHAQGANLRGGTAWVSLEPCSHHGRTPPCCDALIDAGLARVVVAAIDPNPQVAGQGVARLRAAGIQVDMASEEAARATRELNIGFWSRMVRGWPWVRAKAAVSLDGRMALADGRSQWITGDAARADGHAWRRRAGAVLTGRGTVQADDPRLDVRQVPTELQPLRVVVDAGFATPPQARLLQPPGAALIAGTQADAARIAALQAVGARCEVLPTTPEGGVDLPALMTLLAARGINELHVEAGPTLTGALWQAGLVDEWLVYLAPKLIGPGLDFAHIPALGALGDARAMRFIDCVPVGTDLRLRVRVAGHDDFFTADH